MKQSLRAKKNLFSSRTGIIPAEGNCTCANCLTLISLEEAIWIGGDPFTLTSDGLGDGDTHPYCRICYNRAHLEGKLTDQPYGLRGVS